MPANRLKSPGRSPRTPYSTRRRRGQSAGTTQQRTLDSYFGRNTGNDPQQREPEVVQAPPPATPPAPPPAMCHWKNRYLRYHQQEEGGEGRGEELEVKSILEENHMTPDYNLCLLQMAKYMSQTFHCMTVGSEGEHRILESIRGQRLYEKARACMPESMIQTEDPWSSLALMLVLADGVEELWQLVVSLRNSLTPEQLSEFLWCSATLLRAMADKRVKISNRLHYNIYYVLHLIENIVPPTNMSSDRANAPQMTSEQQQILNHDPKADHVVKIMAFAGTGKTTTLKWYHEKLSQFSFNLYSVFKVLPDGERSIVWAKVVTNTINNFWASTDPDIDTQHVPEWFVNTSGNKERPDKEKTKMFLKNAKHIWEKMKEVEPTSEDAYRMYHDGYLKLWQLEGGKMKDYDVIFIDEAQDCTQAIMDILLSQPCAKILVGDPHQQIYSFRGAINSLNTIQHTHIYYLTQSFRFGPEIAYVGSTILEVGKHVRKTMVGGHQKDCVRGQDVEMWRRFKTGVGGADGKLAVLCRTNALVFEEAVRLTDPMTNSRIHIIGGPSKLGLSRIQDIWALKHDLFSGIKDHFIRQISVQPIDGMVGYGGLQRYAKLTEDQDLLWKIAMVKKHDHQIPEQIKRIRERHLRTPQKADFILSSMHKAKGLEFDTVFIMDDSRALQASPAQEHGGDQSSVSDDDWNLMYMAVTRAKRNVFLTKTIIDILGRAGEYFLRSELSTVPAENPVLQCSTPKCSNTRLRMQRLPIRCVDGVEKDGAEGLTSVDEMAGHLAFLINSKKPSA
ncbi:F-box DNA helicase 1-like [Sardina pilchardus]|uniref:F-box DNA helicase 1-like n=1 Tax=Sardina pilchardus TaxID=27697 RepID=UPI002E101942